jgi:hypothetical protein
LFPALEVAVWDIVYARGKLGVFEDVMNDFPRVTIPQLVFGRHPLRDWTSLRPEPLVLGSVGFPPNVPQSDRINLCMEVSVVRDWGSVVVGDEGSGPNVEELINNT